MLCVSKRTQSIPRYLRLSFLTLQRGNAVGDAPRHRSAPRRRVRTGRGASRTACDAERRTIVRLAALVMNGSWRAIVPHAPAWECRG
ncbi:hypothetical protein B1F69_24410 [Pseudomonas syringae]|nr:hypothetical protein B1F69_24410 [Pseudomonas syringae]